MPFSYYCHFLIQVLHCRKRRSSQGDDAQIESDPESTDLASKSNKNRARRDVLHNGVVSVKALPLSQEIVFKSLYEEAQLIRVGDEEIRLSMGGAYTLGILIMSAVCRYDAC